MQKTLSKSKKYKSKVIESFYIGEGMGFLGLIKWLFRIILIICLCDTQGSFLKGFLLYLIILGVYFCITYLIGHILKKKSYPHLCQYKEKYDKLFKEYYFGVMNECGLVYDEKQNQFIKILTNNASIIMNKNKISILETSLSKYGKTILVKNDNVEFQVPEGLNEIKLSSLDFTKKYKIYSIQGTYANVYFTPSTQKKYLQIYDSLDNFESVILENHNVEIIFNNLSYRYKLFWGGAWFQSFDIILDPNGTWFNIFFEDNFKEISDILIKNINQCLYIEEIYNKII